MTTNENCSSGETPRKGSRQYEFRGVVYDAVGFADVHKLLEYDDYRQDDIILATYPKSGTRWMQEILFAITQDGSTKRVGDDDTSERFPFLEATYRYKGRRLAFEVLPEMKSPRLIKTHMQREFFDNAIRKNAKFVIVNRNPKDVMVSYYHFYKMVPEFEFDGDFSAFFELFKSKKIVQGDWFDWVLGWWEEKDNPNVHFVTYEAMKKDIVKETRRVAEFLGRDFSDDVIQDIVDSCSFGKLKDKRMKDAAQEKEGSGHFRKGVVGDWANHFTPEQAAYVDELFRTKMANIDLGFEC